MVLKNTRKMRDHEWDPESMKRAQAAISEGMGFRTASAIFNIDRKALKRCFKYHVSHPPPKPVGPKPIFTSLQEHQIVQHINLLNSQMYGVTKKDVRCIAFHLAEFYNLVHNFDTFEGLAGIDWLDGFLKRHYEIIPFLTTWFAELDQEHNKHMVSKFFRLLREAMTANLYKAESIFNASEIPFSGSSSKCVRNLAGRLIEPMAPGLNFESVSSIVCMSARGIFIPPMIIFHRKCIKEEMLKGGPAGTVFACNDHGWVEANVFQAWFEHFLKIAKPSAEEPALLILEGYLMYTNFRKVAARAKERFVTLVFLTPRLSHRLNPMEVSVAKELSKCYEREVASVLGVNSEVVGRVTPKNVRRDKITPIFAKAYAQAATANNAVNGFWKCGIYPFNPDIFAEEDFEIDHHQ